MGKSSLGEVRGQSNPAEGTVGDSMAFSRSRRIASMVREERMSKKGR